MKKVWALGAVQLKLGIMRFFCWSNDFDPQNQFQSHAQLWVRLVILIIRNWYPLTMDEAT